MSYELCTYPPSLFESPKMLRPANKPTLANAIAKKIQYEAVQSSTVECCQQSFHNIIDRDWLLHKVPWQQNETFDAIYDTYVDYVVRNYGKYCIVFVGYSLQPSTKDIAHLRQTKGLLSRTVEFTGSMRLKIKKDEFLRNVDNKNRIIHAIGNKLTMFGCQCLMHQMMLTF